MSSRPVALRLSHDRLQIAQRRFVVLASPDEIAVADDRLQGAADLGGNRQRQLGHDFHRPVLAEGHVQLLRDPGDRENLGDRLQRRDVRLTERVGLPRDDVQRADRAAARTSGIRSTERNPDVSRMFASR